MKDSIRMILIGMGAGVLIARMLVSVMKTLLYGVDPLDLTTWMVCSISLALVGIAASLIPAIRANRVDPVGSLRAE